MASFLTDPHIQYTPYIETNPTDAYLRVGMYKEQQLAAGIQKVQQTVDTLTGLPIIKEEDKKYLQDKLSSLKNGITKNLSGDFSDSRITNQIAGAAKQIYSDPIVQNSVQGTMAIQKVRADIEAAQKAGKSAPENEWVVEDGINKWLSDKTVGSKSSQYFSGYTPYVDVMDDFLKTWKEVHPDSKLTQDAFRLGTDGKTVEINPVMNQESYEGITPDKVRQVANLVFSKAQNQNQLSISGAYKYRGMTPEQIGQNLQTNYTATLDNVNKKLTDLQVEMAISKSADKTLLSQQIEQWKKFGSDTLDKYNSYAALLNSNPDAVKADIYKEELTSQMMNSFQWSKTSNEIKDNPLWKVHMDNLKYELDLAKFDWDKEKDKADMLLKRMKLEGEAGESKNLPTVTVPMNVETLQANAGSQSFYDLKDGFVSRFNNDAYEGINLIANSTEGENKVLPPFKKTAQGWIPNVDPTGKTGYTDATKAHEAYADLYTKARATYNNGNGSDPLVNDLFSKLDPTIKSIEYYGEKAKDLEAKHMPVTNKLKAILPPNFNYSVVDPFTHETKSANANDIALYYQYKEGEGNVSASAKQQLLNKLGFNGLENLKHEIEDVKNVRTGTPEGGLKQLYDQFKGVAKKDPTILPSLIAKEQDFKDAQLGFNPGKTNFVPKDENQAKQIATRIRTLAQERSAGNNASSFVEVLNQLKETKDEKATEKTLGYYKMPSAKGDKYFISVNGKDAEVTKTDLESIFPSAKLDDPFWNKFGTTLALSQLTKTDVNGRGIESAYPVKMPSGSKYFVKYHLVGDGNSNYALKLYVNDTKGNIILKGVPWSLADGMMTQQQTYDLINNLSSDTVIEAIINQNK